MHEGFSLSSAPGIVRLVVKILLFFTFTLLPGSAPKFRPACSAAGFEVPDTAVPQ